MPPVQQKPAGQQTPRQHSKPGSQHDWPQTAPETIPPAVQRWQAGGFGSIGLGTQVSFSSQSSQALQGSQVWVAELHLVHGPHCGSQAPRKQSSHGPHVRPRKPQLCLSVRVSVQAPLQLR